MLMKKKGQAGEAVKYITKKKATKHLRINLVEFRKLCILKGVFPREPKSRKKAQKGDMKIKELFLKKDIAFLTHEPLIWKLRDIKVFKKKVKRAKNKKESEKYDNLKSQVPIYKLDHIVRERYPTFIDALHDLDDPLCMLFLFSVLPNKQEVDIDLVKMSRRLTVEFMHYVIEARALRKVFISFKGYFYEVEIMGCVIRWIAPHPFLPSDTADVNMSVMSTFCEFYVTLMGFVNYRLYQSLNLKYPPVLKFKSDEVVDSKYEGEVDRMITKMLKRQAEEKADEESDESYISERIASLNMELQRTVIDEDETKIDTHLMAGDNEELIITARKQHEQMKKLQCLFNGLKFFVGRENNRESLTFVIRACGGLVSWDKLYEGSTYSEDDQTVTHQITDRPKPAKNYLSRYYVQPQWVYDSINARQLLPVQDYFPEVTLPPHLSPFVDAFNSLKYIPPEQKNLVTGNTVSATALKDEDLDLKLNRLEKSLKARKKKAVAKNEFIERKKQQYKSKREEEIKYYERKEKEEDGLPVDEDEEEESEVEMQVTDLPEEKVDKEIQLAKMAVQRGRLQTQNKKRQIAREKVETVKRQEMMIPKKQRRLYENMVRIEERKKGRIKALQRKRRTIEERKLLPLLYQRQRKREQKNA